MASINMWIASCRILIFSRDMSYGIAELLPQMFQFSRSGTKHAIIPKPKATVSHGLLLWFQRISTYQTISNAVSEVQGFLRTLPRSIGYLSDSTGILRSSAGNFLFVTTAIDAVEGGQLCFDDVENQPPGHLSSLCEVFFNRLFRDAGVDFQASGPVLEMVAAAREPLSRKQAVAVTGLDAEKELRPSPRSLGRVCTCPGGTLFALPPLAV